MSKSSAFLTRGVWLLGLAFVGLAFALRVLYLEARVFHIDEFISMLAVQMTVQKGVPVLPSGFLYNQGALFSYLAAAFVVVLGFSEEVVRWSSLLLGVLLVVLFWRAARRLFNLRSAALIALALAALDATMIAWAGRARMYALAHLFVLLTLYFLLMGFVVKPGRRYRLAAIVCLLAGMFSHSVVVLLLPILVVSTGLVVWLSRKSFNQAIAWSELWPELGLLVVVAGLGTGAGVAYQVPTLSGSSGLDGGQAEGALAGFGGVLAKFLDPGLAWNRIDDFVYYFTTPAYAPVVLLACVALGYALYRLLKGQPTRADLVIIFLVLVFLLTIGELGFLLTHTWRKTRYLYILSLTPLLLTAAGGLAYLGLILGRALRWPPNVRQNVGAVVGSLLVAGWWLGPAIDLADTQGTGGYDTAFAWVQDQWQEGDRVATNHPSASYLYLGRGDYYASQGAARVLPDEESEDFIDRYVGSALIDSLGELNAALDAPGRLWFVVGQDRLFGRFSPHFYQQVFARMQVVRRDSTVLVFLERAGVGPLPAEPGQTVKGDWPGIITLGGFNFDTSTLGPGSTAQLDLYWRPQSDVPNQVYKVFVHLRDPNNETVAQADHFLLQGYLRADTLRQLHQEGEWLRESTLLTLPTRFEAGDYRLLVGLYQPNTFERPTLSADASGENAVILETIVVPRNDGGG